MEKKSPKYLIFQIIDENRIEKKKFIYICTRKLKSLKI